MGALADKAKGLIPVTWKALAADPRHGDAALQEHIEDAKYELLGATAPAEAAEENLDRMVQIYLAKKAVLNVIPAGIDYWNEQPVQINTEGNSSENQTFTDRTRALEKLAAQFIKETVAMRPDIDTIIVPVIRRQNSRPRVSDGEADNLITPNPFEFPTIYKRPVRIPQ